MRVRIRAYSVLKNYPNTDNCDDNFHDNHDDYYDHDNFDGDISHSRKHSKRSRLGVFSARWASRCTFGCFPVDGLVVFNYASSSTLFTAESVGQS